MQPNFTGVWELINDKSDFGFLPPPRLRVDRIIHDEPRFLLRTRQKDANGDVTVDRDLIIGGDPVEVSINGRARQISSFWNDGELTVITNSAVSGGARRIEDRWTFVDDDSLTIVRLHDLPGGPVRQRLLMRRVRSDVP
jgi:hypothetical protein